MFDLFSVQSFSNMLSSSRSRVHHTVQGRIFIHHEKKFHQFYCKYWHGIQSQRSSLFSYGIFPVIKLGFNKFLQLQAKESTKGIYTNKILSLSFHAATCSSLSCTSFISYVCSHNLFLYVRKGFWLPCSMVCSVSLSRFHD